MADLDIATQTQNDIIGKMSDCNEDEQSSDTTPIKTSGKSTPNTH